MAKFYLQFMINWVFFNFNFEKVNFPYHDRNVPRIPSFCVYIYHLIHFEIGCSNVSDSTTENGLKTRSSIL